MLHVPTLAAIAVFVTAILGGLLMLAWRREQNSSALLWWGAAYVLAALSFALVSARGRIPDESATISPPFFTAAEVSLTRSGM